MDSRDHRTELSSGGRTGIWALNNRSALALGFHTGLATPDSPEYNRTERNPEYFVWIRLLELNRLDYNPGVRHTLYLPHYMALPARIVFGSILMVTRSLRKRRILRKASNPGGKPDEAVGTGSPTN